MNDISLLRPRAVLQRVHALLFPGLLRLLWPVLLAFLAVNLVVRLGLAAAFGQPGWWWPWQLLPALLIGMVFDVAVASVVLAPMAWILALWPRRWQRLLAAGTAVWLLALSVLCLFVAVSEFTFWNEFASRFNFIAVDYLVYTSEVLGNIRESYNLPLLLALVGVLALALWGAVWWAAREAWRHPVRVAWPVLAFWLLAPLSCLLLDARLKEFSADAQLNEVAGNGYFDFWHAFNHNEIAYDRYYLTLPAAKAQAVLAEALSAGGAPRASAHAVSATAAPPGFDRQIANDGPESRLNVVLVSIESLSAEFMASFGGTKGLTPHLDALAQQGMLFTQLYATGTRTVRGLEALTLSVPPTPGHAIVKRPDNAGLFTIGSVFQSKGYEPIFLYGGYGYFDNMNAFFSGNGYTVVDRTALEPSQIHFENIWGVADEDLFDLTLRELDRRHAEGRRFFAHVMTTSNHRPFTYPEGRIDIPSKTGRAGGVKYTDWAIGRFIEQARGHAWFRDTVFVLVADHTHKGRGRLELPVENYHIPMIVYSPAHIPAQRVDTLASQIDVAPTVLGLLNFSYRSRFFGHDILREGRADPRALLANYQTVGYYANGRVVELRPNARYRVVDAASGVQQPADVLGQRLVERAVAYYQVASEAYRRGGLRLVPPDTALQARQDTRSSAPQAGL